MEPKVTTDCDGHPFVVVWEATRACDLACLHCRTATQPKRSNFELSTYEGYKLIDQIAELSPQIFVMTGGDPLKRSDMYEFVNYASRRGLRPSLASSATPMLDASSLVKLKGSGLTRLALGLDGSSPEVHDDYRGVPGAWAKTVESIRFARDAGIPIQINTIVSRRNLEDIEPLAALLETLDISTWSLFFSLPRIQGRVVDRLSGWQVEEVFGRLYEISRRVPFEVRTTEASHYRRFVLQQMMAEMNMGLEDLLRGASAVAPEAAANVAMQMPRGLHEARGFIFISHTGEVYPNGFLPLPAGNVRHRRLQDIYLNSPLFVSLRDSSLLKGKCGVCEYREICGGSRARAYATTHDPLAEEPLCVYLPNALRSIPHPGAELTR